MSVSPLPGQASSTAPTAGARWVDRYLEPRIAAQMAGRTLAGLRILQLAPDTLEEADRCAELGALVSIGMLSDGGLDEPARYPLVSIDAYGGIAATDASFDVLVSGRLAELAGGPAAGQHLLAECARVCAPGGGLLATLSTGSPLSLAGAAADEASRRGTLTPMALSTCFDELRMLPVDGHFGWRGGGVPRRMVGALLDFCWRHIVTPARPRLYCGPCNPLMLVWATRRPPLREQS